MIAIEMLMVLCGAAITYAWLLYPLSLRLAARRPRPLEPAQTPAARSVAAIFAAHNEEGHVAARIHNLLEEAPAGVAFRVHVGIDASTDRTVELASAAAAADPRVTVHVFPQRRGKVAVIKDCVARCDAEVLVFSDANTLFRPGALAALLAPLADPRVGGVCGRLALVRDPAAAAADAETESASEEGVYWRWETALKCRESAVDSCLGVNGGIFAMRRDLFWNSMPENTMVDDFVIGMKIREQGCRVVYAPAAVAVEELPALRHEWGRRVRIGAGDFQALVFCRRCLGVRYGRFAWCFWSHKVLRWFTPHLVLLLALCAAPAAVCGSPVGRPLAVASLAAIALFVGLAALGVATKRNTARWARIPALFLHHVSMQAALMAGFVRFLTGNLSGHWTRTPRRTH